MLCTPSCRVPGGRKKNGLRARFSAHPQPAPQCVGEAHWSVGRRRLGRPARPQTEERGVLLGGAVVTIENEPRGVIEIKCPPGFFFFKIRDVGPGDPKYDVRRLNDEGREELYKSMKGLTEVGAKYYDTGMDNQFPAARRQVGGSLPPMPRKSPSLRGTVARLHCLCPIQTVVQGVQHTGEAHHARRDSG